MGNPISKIVLTGATPTWDAIYKTARITASDNVSITLSNVGDPDAGMLNFKQSGAGGFTLQINGTPITVNATGLTQVSWFYDGEDYTFHTNVSGGAASSGATPLTAPTVSVGTVTSTQLELTWTDVANEDGYTAEIAEDAGFTVGYQTAPKGVGVLSHTFTGLTAGTTYYYRVRAEGSGAYSDSTWASGTQATNAAPSETILSAAGGLATGSTGFGTNGREWIGITDESKVMTSGTVHRIKFNLNAPPAGSITSAFIRVWRKDGGGTYDEVYKYELPLASLGVGDNVIDVDTPFSVLAGDYVGAGAVGGLSGNTCFTVTALANASRFVSAGVPVSATDYAWDSATSNGNYMPIQLIELS